RAAKSSLAGARRVGDLLDEFDDGAPNVAPLDPPEGLGKTQRISRIKEIDDIAIALPTAGPVESAAKKEQDRHLQDLGNLLQPCGLNALVSGFKSLHLLIWQPQRETQRLLRQAELEPS